MPLEDESSRSETNVVLSLEAKSSTLLKYNKHKLDLCNKEYIELLTELFFLQHGGNYVDFAQFKKRPSQQLLTYIEQNPILSNGCHKAKPADEHSKPVKTSNQLSSSGSVLVKKLPEVQKQEPIWKKVQPKDLPDISLPEGYEETIGSQEEILERARQEAIVQRRVIELRKQGQWSQRRLPKVREPTRTKTHWDYLLEEMRWLATDFAQERKWKLVTARKVARMVANYHKDSHEREKRAAKEEQQKLRRIASNIARQIRLFWADIQKVVEYKQQCLLDEKRQKALDLHLNFIVDQTAKYSDWLSQGLKSQPTESGLPSPSSQASTTADSDNEFLPQGTSTDDEETIAKEETADPLDVQDEIAMLKQESEMPFEDLISQLPKDLIDNIDKPFNVDEVHSSSENKEPTGIKKEDVEEKIDYSQEVHSEDASDDARKPSPISLRRSARKRPSEDESEVASKKIKTETEAAKDVEFVADQSSSDDEETLKEQEEAEEVDHEKEIKQLQAESDMPIEELVKMYGQVSEGSDVLDAGSKETSPPSSEGEDDSADDSDNDDSDNDDNVDTEIGMDYLLLENDKEKDLAQKDVASENKELDDVAAEALSLQPTGHTLATTQVVTPIPSLLKHTLREYQHIGLDWLVTMYNKRLNGILADEMGLGKTIQTIALLAHLACEKGVWGPHLIVVPTSVILNWEMELKKWAPGFKILTYYGSQKERKLKRTGWTKSNAFHVCITSYKLILQDHSSFRRKKWRYLILDEAQNIKNFKSQRWQALLNFNSQRRLLLTGTPLQNNLMELWSLMHFLMPHVFQSHKEFKEWFSNPMSGMIEGTQEFNEGLVQRLHQVLRPFILRRIKKDVEKQMPNKYEHVVRCQLSKRQRFLYDDFMSRAATKETLAGGHFMSVINVLMQLRKVCNHPNLFEPRPTVSPLSTDRISYHCPSIINKIVEKDFFQDIDVVNLNLHLPSFTRFTSHDLTSLKRLQVRKFNVNKSTQDGAVKAEKCISESIRTTIRNKILHLSQSEIAAVRLGINSNGSCDEDKPPPEKKVKPTPTEGWSMERVDHARYCDVLVERDRLLRNDTFDRIARINRRRCSVVSTYMPADVLQLLTMDVGLNIFLSDMLKTAPQRLEEMSAILDRYVLFIPKASTLPVHFQVPHPSPWRYYSLKSSLHGLRDHLSRHLTAYHRIRRSNVILLPETRLIEYDCGKLQVLNILLRRFWSEKHRILIFTQMTKVLDILEMFLNYHGYRYLRLDGSTPVEERMGRMERFNNDPRIFCFILSTRSGGIGVNLTGADTVVFYDSDWNPTMDAQAQDRCHRIGQTRDVHIYRLISEKTIEENILKKANQKRLLGDLAIEGGEFTTTFFKQNQIKDLFDDPTGLDDLLESSSSQSLPEDKEKGLEKVLLETEEREDVEAAALLQREQDAMMEEFQDSNPAPPTDGTGFKIPKGSKIKDELYRIYNELSPVERYALTFIELSSEAVNDMQLQEAEEKVEQSKKEWELAHMMALKEEEERRMEEADDEIFYTREDNQVFVDLSSGEIMPSWFPPTPPRDDVYMDDCCSLLYDTQKLMSLESLSNVLVKKKIKHPSKLDSKFKSNSRVDIKAPKSLFNRQFGIKKKEKMKHKNPSLQPPKLSHSGLSPVKTERLSSPPPGSVATSDWILNEDWRLIQTVQQVLEIPLSLVTNMPAHTANWELVADSVNMVSSIYRSAKECRQRFDRLVMNLDESKVLTPRKKLKSVSKFPVKNSQARFHLISHNLVSDNNSQFSALYSSRFDACRTICSKRIPPKTAAGTGQFQRNPKHTNILQVKCGINYDNPLHPMQVAAARVKRLANQKKASTEQHVVANVAPPTTPVNVPATLPPGSIQHIGGAIITSGTSVLGKTTIPVNATGLQHLAAAIPLSGGHSNIVVHPSFSRKISTVQGAVPKVQAGKVNPSHAVNPDQHLTIQQPIHSVSLSFPAQSSLVTFATAPTCISTASVRPSIAYPSRGVSTKLSAVQHIKQMKTSTPVKQQPTLTHQQLVLHQHMLKQRQIPQHQQRQVVGSKSLQQKSVLPPGSTHHLLVCAATTPGKMTSQSTVQMINQMVAQQRQQRRLPAKTAVVQAPVTLTVTKLLQSSSNIRHTLLTQNPQVSLQSSQPSVLSVSANNIVMGSASTQQQVISSQHRQFHMAQISQPRASSSSPVVASTPIVMHRPSVVAIGNPLSQLRLRTPTPVSQMVTSTNHPRSSGVEPVSSASMVVSHLPSSEGK